MQSSKDVTSLLDGQHLELLSQRTRQAEQRDSFRDSEDFRSLAGSLSQMLAKNRSTLEQGA